MYTSEKSKLIRKELKEKLGFSSREVSVKTHSYSMGSSINVTLKSVESIRKRPEIEAISNKQEKIHRCEVTQEIMSGGNTYVDISIDYDLKNSIVAAEKEEVSKIAEKSKKDPNQMYKYKGTEFFYDLRAGFSDEGGFIIMDYNSRPTPFINEVVPWIIMNQFSEKAMGTVKDSRSRINQKAAKQLQKLIDRETKDIEEQGGKVHQIENQGKKYFIEIDPKYGWKGRGKDVTLRDEKWIPIKTFPNKGTSPKKNIIESMDKFINDARKS